MQASTLETIARVVMAAALAVSAVTDSLRYKVYNWVTWPAIGAGVLLGLLGGRPAALTMAEGFGAGLAMGLAAMVLFRMGAGDAKLLIAVGTLAGPHVLLYTALYGAIAALPMALFVMWRRGVFRYTLNNFVANGMMRAMGNRDVQIADNSKAGKMPYAAAIALGTVIAVALRGWT